MEVFTIGEIPNCSIAAVDAQNKRLAVCCFGTGFLRKGSGYKLYKFDDWNNRADISIGNVHPYNRLAFDRRGNYVAAAEWDMKCYTHGWVYDVKTGEAIIFTSGCNTIQGPARGGSESVAFSPSGRHLVVSSAYVKSLITDVLKLLGPEKTFNNLLQLEPDKMNKRKFFAWSPSGKVIASVSDGNNGKRVLNTWVLPEGEDEISGNIVVNSVSFKDWGTDPIVSGRMGMDFSPNSRYLAAGGGNKRNGVVQIFDVQEMSLVCESPNLGCEIGVARFSNDGQYVISGGRDGKVSLWKIPFDEGGTLECIDSTQLSGKIVDIGVWDMAEGFFVACESGKDMRISRLAI